LGVRLAERDQATLYLMHLIRVVEEATVAAPAIFERDERTTQTELQKIAESQLRGISHHVLLRYGNPAEQIIAAESELGRAGYPQSALSSRLIPRNRFPVPYSAAPSRLNLGASLIVRSRTNAGVFRFAYQGVKIRLTPQVPVF
jgi:hypothetical protein